MMSCDLFFNLVMCYACCSASNKCLLKVAVMCSNLQQFDKAAGIFEEVNKYSFCSIF